MILLDTFLLHAIIKEKEAAYDYYLYPCRHRHLFRL
jgi:hypothetical protein